MRILQRNAFVNVYVLPLLFLKQCSINTESQNLVIMTGNISLAIACYEKKYNRKRGLDTYLDAALYFKNNAITNTKEGRGQTCGKRNGKEFE